MLLRTVTIDKYYYNNKINKTTRTDKWSLLYKWQPWKFYSSSFFFNVYVIKLYIVCSHPIKVIKNNFLYCNSKKAKFRSNQPHKYIA